MRKVIGSLIVLYVFLIFPVNVHALASKVAKSEKIADVKVTAQKVEEDPQEVPISMDVLSDIDLEDAMLLNTFDLLRFSPNIYMSNTLHGHNVVIRGISALNTASVYSTAAYYVNGVGYAISNMHDNELFDIERIEILKGPQGTLYGRNSASGVINIITKQPGNDLEGKVLAEYGSYNSYRAMAKVSGPLVKDKLFLGLAGQYRGSDGYVTNIYNDDDSALAVAKFNGRATLRWTPSERWDMSLVSDVINTDNNYGVFRWESGAKATDKYEVNHDTTDEWYTERGSYESFNLNYKSDNFQISAISGYSYVEYEKFNDSDLYASSSSRMTNIYGYNHTQYSQEVRISSVGKKRFTWLGGLFGFYDNTEREYTNRNLLANSIMSQAETKIQGTGYAAFGQATYSLLDDLHLTFGLRFDHQTLEGDYHNKVNDSKLNHQLEFDELLPKITLAYDATQDIMLYATVARGYLVGGYNWSQSPVYDTFHYDPEYSWNYETGIKTTWLDKRLLANLSLFYLKVSDKQVSVTDPDTLLSTVVNAAEASSYGIELQVTAKPIINIDVYANIGYNQAKFDEYNYTTMNSDNTAIITQDLSGNYLPYAPEYTYNVGIKYRADCGLMASADWFGTGEMYHNTNNTCKQDPYQIVNLRLGYETKTWEAYLWTKNVFDQHYYTWIHPSGSNLRVFDGEPRTIGVTVAYRF